MTERAHIYADQLWKAAPAAESCHESGVQALFDNIQAYDDMELYNDDSPGTIAFRRELRFYGPAATRHIIHRLQQHKDTTPADRTALAEYLIFCGSHEQSEHIGSLLKDDSVNYQVLYSLEYFGTVANLDQLEHCLTCVAEELAQATHEVRLVWPTILLTRILRVLAAIAQRTHTAAEYTHADRLMSLATAQLRQYNADPHALFHDRERLFHDTHPQLLTQRYEALFRINPYDAGVDHDEYQPHHGEEKAPYRAQQAAARVATVRALYKDGLTPVFARRFESMLSNLEYAEQGEQYTPTLGAEIEIFEPAILPPEAADWDKNERREYMLAKLALYRATETAGVPVGTDAMWEFAHSPVRYYGTLAREVQALCRMELISDARHPLHLTVGGITSEGSKGRESIVLLRALEATGWSVTGDRLLAPSRTGNAAWFYHRSHDGIRERERRVMKLGTRTGVELRTLQFQGLSDFNRTLCSAYYLGAALKAHQKDGQTDETEQRLAAIWAGFTRNTQTIFTRYGMPNPATTTWRIEQVTPRYVTQDEPWRILAGLIDQAAEQDRTSRGAQFVQTMQDTVLTARRQIKTILTQKEPYA